MEASRLRFLTPLQTVENQSLAWGIRFHSCTWREGLAPSWKTELQSLWLCDLPEDMRPLSINGSHGFQTGFERLKGVTYTVATRTSPTRHLMGLVESKEILTITGRGNRKWNGGEIEMT